MIVQPLVENAVFHGIEPSGKKCRLDITARKRNDMLVIEIFDTGVGMAREKIDEILNNLSQKQFGHIGISNVNRRIQLYFGEQYGLRIFSRQGGWTKVVMTLPLIT